MPIHRRDIIRNALVAVSLGAASPVPANAFHPFHVCVGQMQFNPGSSRWEVSLRMHPRDLELALNDVTGKNVTREDPSFPDQVIDFLGNQFFLAYFPDSQDLKAIHKGLSELAPARSLDKAQVNLDRRSTIEWVGMESQRGWLWIHFEMTPPEKMASSGPMYLVHRIFIDRIDAQENSVAILHTRTDRGSLQFKKGELAKLFPEPAKNP